MEQLTNLSNCQIQDILEDLGMLENGNCPYTAEEIFKAGIEYAIDKGLVHNTLCNKLSLNNMKKYIDKDALVLELEKRRNRNSKNKLNIAAALEDNYLLSFIESSKVKEVDLEKEIEDNIE